MKSWLGRHAVTALAMTVAVASGVMWFGEKAADGQTRAYRAPRTHDGKPDLSGVWQVLNSASWDLEDHAAKGGPVVAMGAFGAVPAGLGVVEGGAIPYKPEALAKKKENAKNWLQRDPVVKCYLPGVPRITYMPFPFQIIQSPSTVLISYEFAAATRTIHMVDRRESPVDTWMGWSFGRWEGETLVVDVNSFNDETWFDAAGNYHSSALKVTERYTRTGPDHMMYEATIDDPQVYTRPWKIRMPLYRRVEDGSRLLEFKCVEFVEELVYGHLKKKE